MSTAFKGAGKSASILGPAVLIAGVVKLARTHEMFQRSMNQSLAIMGDVSKAMRGDMKNAALEVARVTKFSASEVADSYFYLASAGLSAKESLAALPTVATFAQAGMFNMAQATDLLTDAQSALGKTSNVASENLREMAKLGDILVKANTLANASVEQFSQALTNKAAAAMKVFGIETEQGMAVLAAFADQGIKGSDAGTAFQIVLRDLTTKAITNAKAFAAHKIAVYDASGELRNIADIMEDVENATEGMSDKLLKATLMEIGFTDKSVAFMAALIGSSQKIREMETALRSASGTMSEVAGKQLTEFQKGLANIKVQALRSATALGWLTDAVGRLMQLAGSHPSLLTFGDPEAVISPLGRLMKARDGINKALAEGAINATGAQKEILEAVEEWRKEVTPKLSAGATGPRPADPISDRMRGIREEAERTESALEEFANKVIESQGKAEREVRALLERLGEAYKAGKLPLEIYTEAVREASEALFEMSGEMKAINEELEALWAASVDRANARNAAAASQEALEAQREQVRLSVRSPHEVLNERMAFLENLNLPADTMERAKLSAMNDFFAAAVANTPPLGGDAKPEPIKRQTEFGAGAMPGGPIFRPPPDQKGLLGKDYHLLHESLKLHSGSVGGFGFPVGGFPIGPPDILRTKLIPSAADPKLHAYEERLADRLEQLQTRLQYDPGSFAKESRPRTFEELIAIAKEQLAATNRNTEALEAISKVGGGFGE